MSTEIIAMNKNAIALAADSFANIHNRCLKTGHDYMGPIIQQKIFSLSEEHSIAIMVYDKLRLHGVPWETIINLYQEHIKHRPLKTTDHYLDSFIKFLTNNKKIFPPSDEQRFFNKDAYNYISKLNGNILELWQNYDFIGPKTSKIQLKSFARLYLKNEIERLEEIDDIPSLSKKTLHNFIHDQIKKLSTQDIDVTFNLHPLEQNDRSMINRILFLSITKNIFEMGKTGLVIAGYGEDQFFPSVSAFDISSIYKNQPKIIKHKTEIISHDNQAHILPFAQSDMVDSFIKGIHPEFESLISSQIMDSTFDLPFRMIDKITDLSSEQKEFWKNELKHIPQENFKTIQKNMTEHIRSNHIQPVINGIKYLSSCELASVAESLVNITSFKKSVSPGDYTVGGATDIAIITKSNGFSWVKRQHDLPISENSLLPV